MSSGSRRDSSNPEAPSGLETPSLQRAASRVWLLVADGERHIVSVELDHPATASDFDGGNIVLFRDNGERQPVFPHGKADAMHGRNVTTIGLPQCRDRICHLSTHLHRDKYQTAN